MTKNTFEHHVFLLAICLSSFCVEGFSGSKWVNTSNYDGCYWSVIGDRTFILHKHTQAAAYIQGYATLSRTYYLNRTYLPMGQFCVRFRKVGFDLSDLRVVGNSSNGQIVTLPQCLNYKSLPSEVTVTFNASCRGSLSAIISDFSVHIPTSETPMRQQSNRNTTTPTKGRGIPTNDVGDIQYVGVVVGAICIALFTLFSCLTIVSARRSNQRGSRRRTIQSVSCPEDEDRPDVVAENAPPSYDAVMACPDMYPQTPQSTPRGTPETTPHLSLHRRALINQHVSSLTALSADSPQLQRQSLTPTVTSDVVGDVPEYPPPPYPGLANGNVSNAISSQDTTGDNAVRESTSRENSSGDTKPRDDRAESENSRASSPETNERHSRTGELENPWVLNSVGNSHIRNRDSNAANANSGEELPQRSRPSESNTISDESRRRSTSSSDGAENDGNEANHPPQKSVPCVESGPQTVVSHLAVV